jgi:hypothetical protein
VIGVPQLLAQVPSWQSLISDDDGQLLATHCELDDLQLPSSHKTGEVAGQILLVGQSSILDLTEPSGHLRALSYSTVGVLH